MTYLPGQRVALVHTSDPHTLLRPGDQGTVRGYHPDQQTVGIDWDNGSHLSICLDAGDRITILDEPSTQPGDQAASTDERWRQVLDAIRAAGAAVGRDAADWWGQDTIGGRASGDVQATARRVLVGIDDGDPAVLDTLPSFDSSGQSVDDTTGWELFAAATGDSAGWFGLRIQQRDEALTAYRDSFDTAVTDRVAELCRMTAGPTGDGRDLDHLHPDRVRIGSVGVFAGDWAWHAHRTGPCASRSGSSAPSSTPFPDHEDHLCTEVSNAGRTSSSADERESRSARSLPRAFERQGVAGRVALPGKRYLIWSAQPARTRISVATSAAARSLVTVKSSMGVVVGIRLCSCSALSSESPARRDQPLHDLQRFTLARWTARRQRAWWTGHDPLRRWRHPRSPRPALRRRPRLRGVVRRCAASARRTPRCR
jgi:hypothetical protein